MIQLEHIFKWYTIGGKRHFVLRDINLHIEKGEFVCIMGPSGCGKSTLLHTMGNLDQADEGNYWFDGEAVYSLKSKVRDKLFHSSIGFVFQSYHLIDELTVYENIETPLLYNNTPSSQRKAIVSDMLDQFGIVGKKDLFRASFRGQQQVVGIARAIASSPKVIFADEPTGNLDSKSGKQVMQLLKALHANGTTIVMVTHSEHDAGYADRIINMLDGQISNPYEDRQPI